MAAAGFTIIELMITLAVIGVLLALAAPSFSDIILSSRLSSYANDFVASTHLARSEAIKRNARVSICVSANGTSCTTGNWSQGWVVFHDANNNDAIDSGEAVIERRAALIPGFSMTSSGGALLRFDPAASAGTATTVTVCRKTPSVGNEERVVTLTATGRAWVDKTAAASCP
jgi:type IV fimbrial biogenesis protein FimT